MLLLLPAAGSAAVAGLTGAAVAAASGSGSGSSPMLDSVADWASAAGAIGAAAAVDQDVCRSYRDGEAGDVPGFAAAARAAGCAWMPRSASSAAAASAPPSDAGADGYGHGDWVVAVSRGNRTTLMQKNAQEGSVWLPYKP